MEYTIGSIVFDKWVIKREIGHGSYGTVYEIEKNDFGICTKSALKVIKIPHDEADIRQMLAEGMDNMSVTKFFESAVHEIVREIELMSEMKACENVVHIEDHSVIVKENAIGWDILIRMELLSPLNDILVGKTLNEAEVVKIGTDICKALVYCQKKGIIHRDIKSGNIFVSDAGVYKLGDFGVAKSMDKTSGGSKKGTENYMAPEVYLSKPYNRTVDIYSLGILLYRLMNYNRLPFYPKYPDPISFADRENALIERMQGKKLTAPANAGKNFAHVIMKACSYKSEDRYQSAADMLEALTKIGAEVAKNNRVIEVPTKYVVNNSMNGMTGINSFGNYGNAPENVYAESAEATLATGENSGVLPHYDDDEKSIKFKLIWIIYITVVLLAGLGIFYYIYSSNSSEYKTEYNAMLCFAPYETGEIRRCPQNYAEDFIGLYSNSTYNFVEKQDANGNGAGKAQGNVTDASFSKDGTYSVSITDLDPDLFNGNFYELGVFTDIPDTEDVIITFDSVLINDVEITPKRQPVQSSYKGYYEFELEDLYWKDFYTYMGTTYPNLLITDDDIESIEIVFTVEGLD